MFTLCVVQEMTLDGGEGGVHVARPEGRTARGGTHVGHEQEMRQKRPDHGVGHRFCGGNARDIAVGAKGRR